jgi:hypothetical protein
MKASHVDTPKPPLGIRLRLFLFGAPQFETFTEFIARRERNRERLAKAGIFALVALAGLCGWVAVGMVLG